MTIKKNVTLSLSKGGYPKVRYCRKFYCIAILMLLVSCNASEVAEHGETARQELSAHATIKETQERFRYIASKATPAVVQIYSLVKEDPPKKKRLAGFKRGIWESFKDKIYSFFVVTYKVENRGTGFLINKRGYILTNYHVVENADNVMVKIGSDEQDAKMLGADPVTDLALVKIKGDFGHSTLKLGDSDNLEVGEWVVAIGNPFDLGSTFTAGVISGLRRDDIGIIELEDFIQTDASINPGNSGGPLINIQGEVIGINTAIYSGGSGVGLAVPINIAKAVLPRLVAGEIVERGMLGVSIQNLTPETAEELNVELGDGVLVRRVNPVSPAQKAGIREGDIIETFNERKITDYRELKKAVLSHFAGSEVEIGIIRNGERKSLTATLVPLVPAT